MTTPMAAPLHILSPLAEKRILLFSLRKQLLGRRAYSDCIRYKKGVSDTSRKDAEKEEASSSKVHDRPPLLSQTDGSEPF